MRNSRRVTVLPFAAVALMIGLSFQPARADAIYTVSGTAGGNSVSAIADFAVNGSILTITLQNTSPGNTLEAPTNTLSGLSFLIDGSDPSLTPVSAISPNALVNDTISPCTVVRNVSTCGGPNVDVGGQWGYQSGYSSNLEAVGASGYITTGIAHNYGNFSSNLQGTLDGIGFGVISNKAGPLNGGLDVPLIQDEVILTLSDLPTGTTALDIGNVSFLYGTSPDVVLGGTECTSNCGNLGGGGSGASVPEPSAAVLLIVGLLALAGVRGRLARLREAGRSREI